MFMRLYITIGCVFIVSSTQWSVVLAVIDYLANLNFQFDVDASY